MNEVDIRIRYSSPRCPAELAVSTPLGFETTARVWGVLHGARVTPTQSRLVREGERLVLSATLTERDGSRLSQDRAGEVLEALRTALIRSSRFPFEEPAAASRSAVGFARPGLGLRGDTDACRPCA